MALQGHLVAGVCQKDDTLDPFKKVQHRRSIYLWI